MIVCALCGSDDWLACAPGTEADEPDHDDGPLQLYVPDLAPVAWCGGCLDSLDRYWS